jgi:hypothetical protein
MLIRIREIKTGKLIGEVPAVLGGMNYVPTTKEYLDEAWRCAVEDGLVNSGQRAEYELTVHTS